MGNDFSLSDDSIICVPLIPSLEDVELKSNIFSHTKENDNYTTILFDPVIKKGVARFEVLRISDLIKVGIADESVRYNRKEAPNVRGCDKVVQYDHNIGMFHCGGNWIKGNDKFDDGDRIVMEVYMNRIRFVYKYYQK
ncbi:MAG: hypothetical protein EZS28_028229 [Streblomastix strix]|uniref:Uncharacterized protein n=1 Tax=Streblomastix strix TaxID=222440 RepID=A0A5J4V2G8_9EUKA|nr:MAG: hypothetical protein EZS28_028229 [Streblomastix strix]